MAVLEGINSGNTAEVGQAAASGLHVIGKPIAAVAHYRLSVRFSLIAAQAALSRLFEFRNNHVSNLLVPTRLNIKWIQSAAHTALILDRLLATKVTGFTVLDTVNTVTPAASRKRGTMAAPPGSADIRHVTVAGAAAGMTGGTLTKDGSAYAHLQQILQAAVPTASTVMAAILDALDDVNGSHPWVFAQNEGFVLENEVLLGAAAGSDVVVDMSWAEVTLF